MYKYKIIRFYRDERPSRATGMKYETLEEAQAHCKRPDTRKEGEWFDGYSKI